MTGLSLSSRRIVMVAAALALAGAAVFGGPLLHNALKDRQARADALRYADGLSACDDDMGEVFQPIDERLGAKASTLVIVMPSFKPPRALSVQAGGVREVPLPIHRNPAGRSKMTVGQPGPLSALPPSTTVRIASLTAKDLRHAQAEQLSQFDGVTYYFRSVEGRCAMTTSPQAGTRAEAWANLADALFVHAEAANADVVQQELFGAAVEYRLEALIAD